MSNTRAMYDKAIGYMALMAYVPIEAINLLEYLSNVNGRIIASDITMAKKGEYHYTQD